MTTPTLKSLARRVAEGDRPAVAGLRDELQPQLERILRRALRPSTASGPFTDGLRREAYRVLGTQVHAGAQPCEPRVAAHLANRVVDRLRSTAATLNADETTVNPL